MDRVQVYIANQLVGDWPRSDVQFSDLGSHFQITAEGESLGFSTIYGPAFRVGIAGSLADRVAKVTTQPTTAAVPAPQQVLVPAIPRTKKKRRWPWIVGAILLVGMIANAS